MIKKSNIERKNPVIGNGVFMTFTKGKITCLKRDYALQNCKYISNIMEKVCC